VVARDDAFSDMLVQAIDATAVTQDLTFAFDVSSTDEDTPGTGSDNNQLFARVYGVTGGSFSFDLAGTFNDADFASDAAGDGFVQLANQFVPVANNASFSNSYSLTVDLDAGGTQTPPYQYLIVGFAGGFGSDGTTPSTSSIQIDNVSLSYEVIPEPGSLGLIGAGLLLIAARRRA